MSDHEGRSTAEWLTFVASCAVLVIIVALIAVQLLGDRDPAAPETHRVGEVRVVGGQHYVDVVVTNEGDATAADVQVTASLVIDGETTEGDQTIDFLAGGETADLVFVFDDPPEDGELTVAVSGFEVP
ncbi:CARDB domain-containing protein [Aquihabitans daechungensis]|uniref:CARDB domain-containing protein n=1 Tax=Aquihabitans daechungensis TaxID=1052257 RepID=UPI003BA32D4F